MKFPKMYIFLLFFICVYVYLVRGLASKWTMRKVQFERLLLHYVCGDDNLCKQVRFYVDPSSVLFIFF